MSQSFTVLSYAIQRALLQWLDSHHGNDALNFLIRATGSIHLDAASVWNVATLRLAPQMAEMYIDWVLAPRLQRDGVIRQWKLEVDQLNRREVQHAAAQGREFVDQIELSVATDRDGEDPLRARNLLLMGRRHSTALAKWSMWQASSILAAQQSRRLTADSSTSSSSDLAVASFLLILSGGLNGCAAKCLLPFQTDFMRHLLLGERQARNQGALRDELANEDPLAPWLEGTSDLLATSYPAPSQAYSTMELLLDSRRVAARIARDTSDDDPPPPVWWAGFIVAWTALNMYVSLSRLCRTRQMVIWAMQNGLAQQVQRATAIEQEERHGCKAFPAALQEVNDSDDDDDEADGPKETHSSKSDTSSSGSSTPSISSSSGSNSITVAPQTEPPSRSHTPEPPFALRLHRFVFAEAFGLARLMPDRDGEEQTQQREQQQHQQRDQQGARNGTSSETRPPQDRAARDPLTAVASAIGPLLLIAGLDPTTYTREDGRVDAHLLAIKITVRLARLVGEMALRDTLRRMGDGVGS